MKLTETQLRDVVAILDGIADGKPVPRVPGRLGQFLRHYQQGLRSLASEASTPRNRKSAFVSGDTIGPAGLHPLLDPLVSILHFPLGEVANCLAISEELGGLQSVRLWLKGSSAFAAYTVFRENRGATVGGPYRWTPLNTLTLGEATVEGVDRIPWWQARCLKAVAEDLSRPAHPLEYVTDYRLGGPGLKYFRVFAAFFRSGVWCCLPATGPTRSFEVNAFVHDRDENGLSMLLAYREPWSAAWTVVDMRAVEPKDVAAHALVWLDYQHELRQLELPLAAATSVFDALREAGIRTAALGDYSATRQLLPGPRKLIAMLRRVSAG